MRYFLFSLFVGVAFGFALTGFREVTVRPYPEQNMVQIDHVCGSTRPPTDVKGNNPQILIGRGAGVVASSSE